MDVLGAPGGGVFYVLCAAAKRVCFANQGRAERPADCRAGRSILKIQEFSISDLETSSFSPGQGNQTFARSRSSLRRTIKGGD